MRPIDDAFRAAMEECVPCRGCEAACPSAVQFGQLMEATRAALPAAALARAPGGGVARLPGRAPAALARCSRARGSPGSAQRLHLVPRALRAAPAVGPVARAGRSTCRSAATPDAWLFTGCVMDAWLRDTHRSAARVMRAAGAHVSRDRPRARACCGALHLHAGREDEARALARRVIASMPGRAPVVVDSAGCGAAMKEYGALLGTPRGARVQRAGRDFSEWLARQPLPGCARPATRSSCRTRATSGTCRRRTARCAPCSRPRTTLVETDDDGLCCGAGGAYARHATRAVAAHPRPQGRRAARRGRRRGSDRRVGESRLHGAAPRRGHRRPPSRRPDRGGAR